MVTAKDANRIMGAQVRNTGSGRNPAGDAEYCRYAGNGRELIVAVFYESTTAARFRSTVAADNPAERMTPLGHLGDVAFAMRDTSIANLSGIRFVSRRIEYAVTVQDRSLSHPARMKAAIAAARLILERI